MVSWPLRRITFVACTLMTGLASLSAQDQVPPPDDAAKLQSRLEALEQQVAGLKAQVEQSNEATTALGTSVDKLKNVKDVDNAFAWGGYADVSLDFRSRTDAGDPAGRSVGVAFNPILMYSWRNEWLAAAELNVSSEAGETTTELGQVFIANTSLPNAVILAGLAPLPFGTFSERFSPAWINKFDEIPPAPYDEDFGLFTSDISDMQLQARGVAELGENGRLNWHAFLSQGPTYGSTDGSDDRLSFGGNSGRDHQMPTIGGRLGYQPEPGIEVGVSAMGGSILNNNATFTPQDRRSFVAYGLDAEYHFKGMLLRAEWVALRYDASDDSKVSSQAGYLQASKRLNELGTAWANVEPVIRVGELRRNQPVTTAFEYKRVYEYGIGVNYYHTAYIRSSLIADACNGEAHGLSRIVVNTTFAF